MWLDDENREKRTRMEAIWFWADAWDDARKFYREVLGLKEVHADQDDGEAQFSTDAGPALYLVRGGGPDQAREMPVVGLRFDELETLHQRLLTVGIEVDVRLGEAGITRLRFTDPEGHRFAAYRWELKDAVKPMAVAGMATDDAGRVLLVRVGRRWTFPGAWPTTAKDPSKRWSASPLKRSASAPSILSSTASTTASRGTAFA